MTIALAATWNPRGELSRFSRLLPLFAEAYRGVAVCLPPEAGAQASQEIRRVVSGQFDCRLVESPDWSWGRYLALKTALGFSSSHVHYADMDRLLRWMETRPEEWRVAVEKITACDCLIMGRTPGAYVTHPQSMIQTEVISNRVISFLLGRSMDVSAGSKGFSRAAAAFILAHSRPGRALGADGEWPVLAKRAGFRIDYLEVEGLDWESADRYQEQAADVERQRQLAAALDRDPLHWARRVEIAHEIIEAGLEAAQREIAAPTEATQSARDEYYV